MPAGKCGIDGCAARGRGGKAAGRHWQQTTNSERQSARPEKHTPSAPPRHRTTHFSSPLYKFAFALLCNCSHRSTSRSLPSSVRFLAFLFTLSSSALCLILRLSGVLFCSSCFAPFGLSLAEGVCGSLCCSLVENAESTKTCWQG